ncbi:MAG: hypothetical protein K9K64_14100 [Desulfohalobiaceae bacterium]|nr:hypothetical protein [Desulfohalobiaceae bacterium]
MKEFFTLEYWEDRGWFIGRLRDVPEIFSHGRSLEELKANVIDAYQMTLQTSGIEPPCSTPRLLELGIEV